jgi:predicted lysophospholipase L1 biosynthesis ABC-type transport system permease subunit
MQVSMQVSTAVAAVVSVAVVAAVVSVAAVAATHSDVRCHYCNPARSHPAGSHFR